MATTVGRGLCGIGGLRGRVLGRDEFYYVNASVGRCLGYELLHVVLTDRLFGQRSSRPMYGDDMCRLFVAAACVASHIVLSLLLRMRVIERP
jgi:hypothetical protein